MPKTEIDYSNTIIYKITCKDAGIKDVYVGHTTNFVQRKHAHKQSCVNPKSPNHNCKLYTIIRENGGWTSWRMEIVNFFNCHDHYEARIKEQEYFISLNATLNSIEPMSKPKASIKPLPCVIETTENATKYHCATCHFNTCKNSNYLKHISTPKHQKRTLSTNINHLMPENAVQFICNTCNKGYKERSGLWRHAKICKPIIDACNNNADKDLVMLLIKENSEFKNRMMDAQNKMLEVIKTRTHPQHECT